MTLSQIGEGEQIDEAVPVAGFVSRQVTVSKAEPARIVTNTAAMKEQLTRDKIEKKEKQFFEKKYKKIPADAMATEAACLVAVGAEQSDIDDSLACIQKTQYEALMNIIADPDTVRCNLPILQ